MTTEDRSLRATGRRARNRRLATPNVDGSQLEGYVEHPLAGSSVERVMVVSGWHAWDKGPIAAVTVALDGRVIGRARVGEEPRDDIAAARDDARYAATGWSIHLDLGAVRTATITLDVAVYPEPGRAAVALDPITVSVLGAPTIDESGRRIPIVLGNIDVPAPSSEVELGAVRVRGWARSTYTAASRVVLYANDVELGAARIGVDRADVAGSDNSLEAPLAGFDQVVDLGVLDGSTETVTIRAHVSALDGTVGEVSSAPLAVRTAAGDVEPSLPTLAAPRASSGPMRLLVITHDLGYGGAQLWLHEVLRRAGAGRSFPCTVVSFAHGALGKDLEAMGVEVHVTSPLPVDSSDAYEGRVDELGGWLRERSFTVALVNTFRVFAGADVAARLGIPIVWAVHESWPERLIWTFDHPDRRVDPLVRHDAVRALGAASAVVFESKTTEALYAHLAPDRTVVVPYGIDTEALDRFAAATTKRDARRLLGLSDDARILLVMGTVEPRKAQGMIAEAFASIAESHPDALLVLVGDLQNFYSAGIREFIRRAGLETRIRIEPVTSDAPRWYRASDALVCASDIESLPRSVLDAMCLGLPVVATKVFGLGELLTDGETAVLFEPLDLAELIEALERTLSMAPDDLGQIADAGRALIHAHHDSAAYADDVMALARGVQLDPSALPQSVLIAAGRALRA